MNKNPLTSKTIWGALALALEAGLIAHQVSGDWITTGLAALGIFITIYGFRDAMYTE